MEDQTKVNRDMAIAWKNAWRNRKFRLTTIAGTILFVCILAALPLFFATIEQRQGQILNDWLLLHVPAADVSVATFIIIWSMIALLMVRSIQTPSVFIVAFSSFILLFTLRMITITLFPLNPPVGLIPLKDPLSNLFYVGTQVFITKDLFFSGHTSTQFLIFLCLHKKRDKVLALASTITVGILVLVQHVHYSIDVIAAFVLTYFVFLLGKKIARY